MYMRMNVTVGILSFSCYTYVGTCVHILKTCDNRVFGFQFRTKHSQKQINHCIYNCCTCNSPSAPTVQSSFATYVYIYRVFEKQKQQAPPMFHCAVYRELWLVSRPALKSLTLRFTRSGLQMIAQRWVQCYTIFMCRYHKTTYVSLHVSYIL